MVDDRIILDKTVLDQVSLWKKSKGLTDKLVIGHECLGTKCDYHEIDDVFICKETGNVHGMKMKKRCKNVKFVAFVVQTYLNFFQMVFFFSMR